MQRRVCALRARRARALAFARGFARRMAARGAGRVWLFGSALDPSRFHLASDVDLAVEGLSPEEFFAAYREGMDAPVPVDVLDLDTARPEVRSAVLREGRILAARAD